MLRFQPGSRLLRQAAAVLRGGVALLGLWLSHGDGRAVPGPVVTRPGGALVQRHDSDLLPLGARGFCHLGRPLSPPALQSMTIAEPMTMLTDYALAGVTGWLGWRLFLARAMQ